MTDSIDPTGSPSGESAEPTSVIPVVPPEPVIDETTEVLAILAGKVDKTGTVDKTAEPEVVKAPKEPKKPKEPKPAKGKRRPLARAVLILAPIVGLSALGIAALIAVWAHDVHNSNVVRDTTLAGRNIGGQSIDALRATIADLNTEFAKAAVTITGAGSAVSANAGDLGISIDTDATAAAALAVGHRGSVLRRPLDWFGSMISSAHRTPFVVTVDKAKLTSVVRQLEGSMLVSATDAQVSLVSGKFVVTPSTPGTGIDIEQLAAELDGRRFDTISTLTLTAQPVPLPPDFGDADAQTLADRLNTLANQPLSIKVDTLVKVIDPAMVKSWLLPEIDTNTGTFTVAVDGTKITNDLSVLFGQAGNRGLPATFRIDYPSFDLSKHPAGKIAIVPGSDSTVCCQAAPEKVLQALATPLSEPLELSLRTKSAAESVQDASLLGITERISTFTTPYPCCQNRVTNIHKIADAARGAVVLPGQTFSVNGYVGERTPEKGYVKDAGIYYGAHVIQYGGGTSQFTTTLFNNAFFAGMDIVDYQMHTEYFSRYPYGREATLSFPHPDLKIKNISDHAILIWTYYTNTSLTVELYGTHFVSYADQTAQSVTPSGTCTYVRTERTRTFLDGTTKKDYFATTYYQPLTKDCKGTPADKYDENFNVITTTTKPAATTPPPTTTTATTTAVPTT